MIGRIAIAPPKERAITQFARPATLNKAFIAGFPQGGCKVSIGANKVSMTEIIDRLTIGMTEKILKYLSSSYQEIGNRTYLCVIDDVKVLLINNSSLLHLRASFKGDHSLSKANEWNETKRFTRCYVESNGSIVLEADYSLEGGVTLENVGNFFALFRASLQAFCDEVM